MYTYTYALKIQSIFHTVLKSTAEFEISDDILLLI